MREREAGMTHRDVVPEAPDAEVAAADVRVVQQEDAALPELREPALDVVGDRLVRVAAVDVKQVDRPVHESVRRLVERLREQRRERPVERVVVGPQLLEHLGPVRARVRVALPRVDGVAPCPEAERLHRLAQGAVRVALPRAQLDENTRPQRGHGEEGERDVLVPARDVRQPAGLVEHDGMVERLEHMPRHGNSALPPTGPPLTEW